MCVDMGTLKVYHFRGFMDTVQYCELLSSCYTLDIQNLFIM